MQTITVNPPPEARAWLSGNPNPSGLATNRFPTTRHALEFIDRLYAAGASEVLVENPFVDADGFPYADALLVRASDTADARWMLERFCENEGPGEVPPGDFTMHVSGDHIRLWWD